jgi:hypothetical protein
MLCAHKEKTMYDPNAEETEQDAIRYEALRRQQIRTQAERRSQARRLERERPAQIPASMQQPRPMPNR